LNTQDRFPVLRTQVVPTCATQLIHSPPAAAEWLRLQNTTVGEILDGMLKPAGLGYRVETDHIRLVPRE